MKWTPSVASELISNTGFSDISLAAFGRKELEIAEVIQPPFRDNSRLHSL